MPRLYDKIKKILEPNKIYALTTFKKVIYIQILEIKEDAIICFNYNINSKDTFSISFIYTKYLVGNLLICG